MALLMEVYQIAYSGLITINARRLPTGLGLLDATYPAWTPLATVHMHIVYKMAMMVYKCLYGIATPYLAFDCVPVTSMVSQRHLRSAVSGCLTVTGMNTRIGTKNFAAAGAKICHSLPADLWLQAQSIGTLKQYLFKCHERIWGFLFCAIQIYWLRLLLHEQLGL